MFVKGALYYKLENLTVSFAPKLRQMGQNLYQRGHALQADMAHEDTLQPSLRCVAHGDNVPAALASDWIAPNAVLIGDVKMGAGSSAWHGVTMRGDRASISVGKNTLIQDNSHIGSNHSQAGDQVNIGDNVYVGANARLEPCELESFSYVGMGASVGKGSHVESFAVVAAGA
jgi:carbonic anhydrase/acetyltransferase-like protein (isoleucine patch superfamily)